MIVLALETATRRGSLGLWRDGVSEGRAGDGTHTHGQRLPCEVLDWLAARGLTTRDVDCYGVTSGPGSFTGLRIGMAAVQGFALPASRRVVPVPTLEALAEAFLAGAPSWSGLLVACLDGQRGEVFAAAYTARRATTADDLVPALVAEVGPPSRLAPRLATLAGDGGVALVGEAAAKYGPELSAGLPAHRVVVPAMTLAEATARIASRRVAAAVAPHALRPVYVRRPDVELARGRTQARHASGAPGDGIVVRRATPDDFAMVATLQSRAFTNPWGVEAIRWEIEHTDVARLYVLEAPGAGVVAYCACWIVFDELHINSLAVDEPRRRRGLARRLLDEVFRDAVAAGARGATLEVRESNVAARELYEGLGFKVEARRRDYYQHPREDALVLWHRRLPDR
jgi:ribosomal-protein-alanine N-acetyltransferase